MGDIVSKTTSNEDILKRLELELEELRVSMKVTIKELEEKKEQEIEEYINKTIDSNSSFYVNFGSMLRKDLEQEYNKKIQATKDKFKDEEDKLISKIEKLKFEEPENANLVDEYALLNFELEEEQKRLDSLIFNLSNFKYEYNDQNQIINGFEWREIYQKMDLVSKKIKNIKEQIKNIEEKNSLVSDESLFIELPTDEDIKELTDFIIPDYEKTDGNVVVNENGDLFKIIYEDIIKEIENIKSKDLQEGTGLYNTDDLFDRSFLRLPCGDHFDSDDFNVAINNYYNKPKGTTYVVKESGKEYKVSGLIVYKIISELKKYSTVMLIKDNKISKLDLFRAFGKEESERIVKEIEEETLNKEKNIINFIPKEEVIKVISDLMILKAPYWQKIINNQKQFSNQELPEVEIHELYSDLFHIKQK